MVQFFRNHIDSDHPCAQRLPQHDSRQANPAAAKHGKPLARAQLRAPGQCRPSRCDPTPHGGSNRWVKPLWQGRKIGIRKRDSNKFGIRTRGIEPRQHLRVADGLRARLARRAGAAGQDKRGNYLVANLPARDACPDRHNLSAKFVP